jgi:hypothetical protein
MWKVAGTVSEAQPFSVEQGFGFPLAVVGGESSLFQGMPLTQIDYSANYNQDGVLAGRETTLVPVTTPDTSTIDVVLTLPETTNLDGVSSISSGGTVYLPAVDAGDPQAGEFVVNSVSKTVTVKQRSSGEMVTGAQAVVHATTDSIPTDLAPPHFLQDLLTMPIKGKLTWSIPLNGHPTGQFSFVTTRTGIDALRQRLKKGSEFQIWDIGFSVSSFSEKLQPLTDFPAGIYEGEVSLTGKWDTTDRQKPCYYTPEAAVTKTGKAQDPDCLVGGSGAGSAISSAKKTISISDLAKQVGVRVDFAAGAPGSMAAAKIGVGSWDCEIDQSAPRDASTSWLSEIQSRLECNNCRVDLSSPASVKVVSWDAFTSWQYDVSASPPELSYQGTATRSPDFRGYGFEYNNRVVSGEFLNTAKPSNGEDTQGRSDQKPDWERRQRKQKRDVTGDPDPRQPPENSRSIKTMSLNWNQSGNTKTEIVTITEDGYPIRVIETIFGWWYTSLEVVREVINGDKRVRTIDASPFPFWRICQQKVRDIIYDPDTGYELTAYTTGYRMSQAKQESDDGLELLAAADALAADNNDKVARAEYEAYRFRYVPISGRTLMSLHQHWDYYIDAQEDPRFFPYKVCNRDGSSSWALAIDPGWAPAFFVKESLNFYSSICVVPNPENLSKGEDDPKSPDLMSGEEYYEYHRVDILPSENTRKNSLSVGVTTGEKGDPDRYTEYTTKDSAQNANFKDKAVETSASIPPTQGRPPLANRAPMYTLKEPPEEKNKVNADPEQAKFDFLLNTPGYDTESPIGGSESFDKVETEDQLRIAAKCRLKLNDLQNTVNYSGKTPFNARLRPADKITLTQGIAETHRVQVLSVSNEVEINGMSEGLLEIVPSPTSFTAGIDRVIPLTITKVPAIGQDGASSPTFYASQVRTIGFKLGDTYGQIRFRRNL